MIPDSAIAFALAKQANGLATRAIEILDDDTTPTAKRAARSLLLAANLVLTEARALDAERVAPLVMGLDQRIADALGRGV